MTATAIAAGRETARREAQSGQQAGRPAAAEEAVAGRRADAVTESH